MKNKSFPGSNSIGASVNMDPAPKCTKAVSLQAEATVPRTTPQGDSFCEVFEFTWNLLRHKYLRGLSSSNLCIYIYRLVSLGVLKML